MSNRLEISLCNLYNVSYYHEEVIDHLHIFVMVYNHGYL